MRDTLDLPHMANQIAASVRRLRKSRDWTQEQLAEAAGVSRSTINKIEKGERDHDHSTVQAIARALGVAIGEITGETPESSGLSHDALLIAEAFEQIVDVEDRAALKRFVLGFVRGLPSRR